MMVDKRGQQIPRKPLHYGV